MMYAKDLVWACDENQLFNVFVESRTFNGVTQEMLLSALDTAMLHEEIYVVDFVLPSRHDINDRFIPSLNISIRNTSNHRSDVCMFAWIINGMIDCARDSDLK